MVAPERRRQGLGDALLRTWDRHVGASIGLGLSASSHQLLQKAALAEPRAAARPGEAAEPARAAAAAVAGGDQSPRLVRHVSVDPARRAHAARCRAKCGSSATSTTASRGCGIASPAASRSRCAVTRAYLNWKYIQPPHVRYNVAALYARRRGRGLRRVPPRLGAAPARDAARRFPRRPARSRRGSSRSFGGSIARRARRTRTRSGRSRSTKASGSS